MTSWVNYAELYPDNTVVGTVKVQQNIYSPQTDDHRELFVYLPPSYAKTNKRYPVLYMHDGQNMFDANLSYSGEWCVDESFEMLSQEGIEAIVVGIPNLDAATPGARMEQYSPFPNASLGVKGHGDNYLAFLIETVKSLIDNNFRTLGDRDHTGIMGSSMGGLISLYAYFRFPEVFGYAGVMSPAFWFTDNDAIFTYVSTQAYVAGKLYMDIGTDELGHVPPGEQRGWVTSEVYLNGAQRMDGILREIGFMPGDRYRYVEDQDAPHHESAWARRLPDAIRFWLGE